jgi:hypothetical protein
MEEAAEGFGAGFIGAVVLGVGIGIGLTVAGAGLPGSGDATSSERLCRWTGICYANTDDMASFGRRIGSGIGLGTGFIVAATALNWAVEQWDKLQSG